MMDRALWKAKKCDDGEWIVGYYRTNLCANHWITNVRNENKIVFEEYEIDPSTLCQCTGLKDKNGQLIFEGDKVFISDDDYNPVGTYIIQWHGEHDYPAFDLDQDICYGESNNISWVLANWFMEVIGSIHDEDKNNG